MSNDEIIMELPAIKKEKRDAWKDLTIYLIFCVILLSVVYILMDNNPTYILNDDYVISKAELDDLAKQTNNNSIKLCKKGVDYCLRLVKIDNNG